MTFDVSLTGVSADNPIPGVYAEARFAQGESSGDHGPKTILIMAPKTSDGSITVDTEIYGPITSEDDAIVKVGARSIARGMVRAFLKTCKNALVYVVCPTAATGTAALDEVTISFSSGSNPTAAGVAQIWFAGELAASYAYTTSDTATTIAAGLVSSFNQKTWLPATANNSSGVITITGSTTGKELNSIRFRASVTAGTNVVTTITADTAFGASGNGSAAIGTGTVSYTSALAAILARKFSYIVPSSQEGTPLGALMTQVTTQALPSTGFRQLVVIGAALTPSAAATLASGASLNNARARFVNQEEAPLPHYVNGAAAAAIAFLEEVPDPSVNLDSWGLKEGQASPFKRPYNDSAIPTTAELTSMLNNGVTPIGVAENGTAYIVRSVTTRCKDSGGNYDYRARDTTVVCVGDRFTDDAAVKLAQGPWTKVCEDPVDPNRQPPAQFATPKRVRASIETLVRDYCDRGWFDPAKRQTVLDAIQCGISSLNPSRIDTQVPAYSAVNLHAHALLVKESSPPV